MPLTELLKEENWTDYDNKKIKDQRDGRFFACTEKWEVDYLKDLIKRKHPRFSEDQILSAIQNCCITIPAPRPRKTFIECVFKRLQIIN